MKKSILRIIVAIAAAVVLAAPVGPQMAHAATGPLCYVDMDATGGTNNGNSWANAYLSLQSALGDTNCTEIWVAEGLYKPGAARTNSFNVRPGVAVYGGFAGTEASRSERNWSANITVLSGDVDNNDTTDANGVVQNYTDITGNNSYHVTFFDGTLTAVTSTTVLDGFVVTAGKANGTALESHGGALFCLAPHAATWCYPTVSNTTFISNFAGLTGGAIYNLGTDGGRSNIIIRDVTFRRNHAEMYGGAMDSDGSWGGNNSPSLVRVKFEQNSAPFAGGALHNNGYHGISSPFLTDVTFSDNTSADGYGGAMFNLGAAGTSGGYLSQVTFSNNSAQYGGGAIYTDGTDGGEGTVVLSDVTFYNNSANYGGAMYNNGEGGASNATLTRVTFDHNTAVGSGGAMLNFGEYSGNASPTLTNVTFSGNGATYGGAMCNFGDNSGTSYPTLRNVTFNGNHSSADGGAIFHSGNSGTAHLILTNVILWGDSAAANGDEIYNDAATAAISYSVVQGSGGSGGSWDSSLGADDGNNLDADPMLGLLSDNGRHTGTIPLRWGSSAIDAGNDATCAASPVSGLDQRAVDRPQGTHCDIGALERVPPKVTADFESDGISDIGYFHPATGLWAILQSSDDFSYSSPRYYSWGQTGDIIAPGDYDGDGRMDPTVRRPPASGQSAAYLMLLSNNDYEYSLSRTVPAGWPGLGDTPVVGDYNGDGITDPAIWRGSTGAWIIPLSPNFTTYAFYSWGQSGDKPIAADVDGDLQTDIGYWRPSTGVWGFLLSSQNYSFASPMFFNWGTAVDIPVMADYDGDLLADPAVVIPPAGGQSRAYRILLSSQSYNPAMSVTIPAGWPGLGDTPVPADYDGDGLADPAIWRNNAGVWIIPKSSTNYANYMFAAWGASGDQLAR
jgi:predicted outer membrane repeat protein